MNGELIQQRKTWFRYFPEGNVEFMMFVRVLALLLILAVGIVNDLQRPVVLLALILLIWADYLLMVWWLVQMASDLTELSEEQSPPAGIIRTIRMQAIGLICLPSLLAVLLISPWPRVLFGSAYLDPYGSLRGVVNLVILPILLALYLLTVVVAFRAMQRLQVASSPWCVLLLIPVLHWFALHRIVRELHLRIQGHRRELNPDDATDESVPGMIAVDVLWVVALLPWLIYALVQLFAGYQPSLTVVAVLGMLLASLFAIVEVAGMEQLQRRFVSLIRKAD